MEYGWISLIPPLLAIILAWITKDALLSLFIGVFVGATILAGYNPLLGFMDTCSNYIAGQVADTWNAQVFIFLLVLGGFIGVLGRAGGMKDVGDYFAKKAKTVKKTLFITWILGLVVFIDDYVNMLVVGNTMRPVTDKLKISREKLSYVMDSTGSPVSSVALISSWIAFALALIKSNFEKLNIDLSVYGTFIHSIPYNYYSIFAVLLVAIVILLEKDFGPMYRAEVRARTTGKVIRDGAMPMMSKELTEIKGSDKDKSLNVFETLGLLVFVIVICMLGMWYDGGGLKGASLIDALSNGGTAVGLLWSSFASSIVAMAIVVSRRKISFKDTLESFIDGCKSMLFACIILLMVWAIAGVTADIGTAEYVIHHAEKFISPGAVPAFVFVIAFFIAFTTGSSWTAQGIVMPIAIPLAYKLGGAEFASSGLLYAAVGAVLTGGAGGGHCSPLSDCTILASTGSGSDHMDHVNTQLPYAILALVVSLFVGYIPIGFGVSPWILIPVGLIVEALFIKYVGKSIRYEDIKDLDYKTLGSQKTSKVS
ncbi:MAG: Na+/H+ antiporter NhaC family protein [Marinisporobacter sp.]|jgi:Na+/H+ antiporter NhaC|nr:Na+/H+ antiporter NhaC family protein [Marinisporobacter sp.]